MTEQSPTSRRRAPKLAGVTVPLFALRTDRSWGIGELGDLPAFAAWMKEEAGIGLIQLLPLAEISGAETSPYAGLTAFALDPMYLSLASVPELAGRERQALGAEGLAALERARTAKRVDYGAVRALKHRALAYAFRRFLGEELGRATPRAHEFLAFVDAERAWLDDYALFRALKDAHDGRAWWDWAPPVRDRDPDALASARMDLGTDVLFFEYVQWLARAEWHVVREALRSMGVELMGDLPFMVGRDSADVWAGREGFKLDASVGAPPDAFDEEGQDWDLPPYDWARMKGDDYAWLRRRAREMARLYDRFRIDHLVGFFRTYQRPHDDKLDADGKLVPGVFDPAAEADQLAHGERVVGAMVESAAKGGATLVAEDLGAVPAFVREAIARLGVPGYKVLIWEKDDGVYRDPKAYPSVSVACFGTHDTPPVAVWWEELSAEQRASFLALPELAPRAKQLGPRFDDKVHAALFDLLARSSSQLALFLFQDLVGSKDRINEPGTTGEQNWTYRLPASIDVMRRDTAVRARLRRVRDILAGARRSR
jgi:4-alpha-glucanotransferase